MSSALVLDPAGRMYGSERVLLDFLEASDVLPGRSGTVTAVSPDGTLTVEIEGRHVGLGSFASARILVLSAAPAAAG